MFADDDSCVSPFLTVSLADQSFIPPDVLGAQLSRCMTHIPPPLNFDNVLKVGDCLTEMRGITEPNCMPR